MMISIADPVQATWIIGAILLIILYLSIRKKAADSWFPVSLTRELKGLAILAVIFSHLGYFLAADHRFLFPLSIGAGIGVNLFLFLSGYGLTAALLKKKTSLREFYGRRLLRLYVPFWIALVGLLLLDLFFLRLNYSWQFIGQSLAGIFLSADLYRDFNSPLWYVTLTVFYYLIFPLVFSRRRPWLSAILIYLVTLLVVTLNPPLLQGVMRLYQVHIMAFPLGMIFAWFFYEPYLFSNITSGKWQERLDGISHPLWLRYSLDKLKQPNFLHTLVRSLGRFIYFLLMICLVIIVCQTAYYSGVGHGVNREQLISLVTMIALVILFIMKKFEFKLLSLFGMYAYEIYLLHWPLIYRYDFFFRFFPAWFAVILYLAVCLALAWGLKYMDTMILARLGVGSQGNSKGKKPQAKALKDRKLKIAAKNEMK